MSTLHYYRCIDCLSVATSENCFRGLECGLCAGPVEYLGQVNGGRIFREETYCPCDERCTSAMGPKCNCACGGVNHGCGLRVRIVEVGTVKRLDIPETGKARRQVAEFRAALSAAAGEIDRLQKLPTIDWGGSRDDVVRLYKLRRAIRLANSRRCHKTRMSDLALVAPPAEAETLFSLCACD